MKSGKLSTLFLALVCCAIMLFGGSSFVLSQNEQAVYATGSTETWILNDEITGFPAKSVVDYVDISFTANNTSYYGIRLNKYGFINYKDGDDSWTENLYNQANDPKWTSSVYKTLIFSSAVDTSSAFYTWLNANATKVHTCNGMTFDNVLTSEGLTISEVGTYNYYLNDDLDLDYSISIESGTLNLCLNGHVLNLNGNCIKNCSNLQIFDCGGTSAVHHFSDNGGVWVWDSTGQATAHTISGGVITGGSGIDYKSSSSLMFTDSYGGGAIINDSATLNIYGGSIVGNSVSSDSYTNCGGAICVDSASSVYIENCTITGNSAGDYGGGIYVTNQDIVACFSVGTKITMSNGTTKNIEDINEGDIVKTIDHETGTLSSEKVCLVYKGESKSRSFTLHFTNDIELSICGCHDLFEQSTMKYVTITENNARNFVGKYFYNANASRFEQLLSVTHDSTPVDYYSIYTAHHLNCVANDMLSVADDIDYMLNIYEFDENLKLDQAQLDADIAEYGLNVYDIESEYMTEEDFDNFNTKYAYIVFGKGLFEKDDMIDIRKDTNEYLENTALASQTSNVKSHATLQSAKLLASGGGSNISSASSIVVLGSNVNITGNSAGGKTDNIYLADSGCCINVVSDSSNISAGITIGYNDGKGTFISSASANTYSSCFSSDNSNYKVVVDDSNNYTIGIESSVPSSGLYIDDSNGNISGVVLVISFGFLVLLVVTRKKFLGSN